MHESKQRSNPESFPKPTIEVAAAVIEKQGRYLITQRSSNVHLAGYWEFPGGKRGGGETLEACVQREVREELGLIVSPPVLMKTLLHEYDDKFVHLNFFHCAVLQGEPRAIGCADWRWVKPADLSQFQFPPADQPVLAELREAGPFGM